MRYPRWPDPSKRIRLAGSSSSQMPQPRPSRTRHHTSMVTPQRSSSTPAAVRAPGVRDELAQRASRDCQEPRSSHYWTRKVAIVTGGSSGLGRALAEAFARAGADVVISARTLETLETAAAQLRQFGTQVHAIAADVTQQNQVELLVEQTVGQFGRIDVLINNVGRSTRGALAETSAEDFA